MGLNIGSTSISDVKIGTTSVSAVYIGTTQVWTAMRNWFAVEDASGSQNTLSITKSNASAPTISVEASSDGMTWQTLGSTDTTPITATVPANGKLYLRATADAWSDTNTVYCNSITMSGNYNVSGSIMSLLYGGNFNDQTVFPNSSSVAIFGNLFNNSSTLLDASNLLLPATSLLERCYQGLFSNCTALTGIPDLPATTLVDGCYSKLFYNCRALTTAPSFNDITSLPHAAMTNMFYNCRALTTAPSFNSLASIGDGALSHCFENCIALTTAPSLSGLTSIPLNGLYGAFMGCSSLTTAPDLSNVTTVGDNGLYYAFKNCTALTTAPDLSNVTSIAQSGLYGTFSNSHITSIDLSSFTLLTSYCLYEAFKYCYYISDIKVGFSSWTGNGLATTPTYNWVSGVPVDGTFHCPSNLPDTRGNDNIPTGWTKTTL